ncbi:hypothetical protein TSMEX_005883, partial [Taenia solium]
MQVCNPPRTATSAVLVMLGACHVCGVRALRTLTTCICVGKEVEHHHHFLLSERKRCCCQRVEPFNRLTISIFEACFSIRSIYFSQLSSGLFLLAQ